MNAQAVLAESKPPDTPRENDDFLSRQIITYIGNKRNLLHFIGRGIKQIQNRLGKDKLIMFDAFSGSGIVARYFKRFSDLLIVNDIEKYSALINRCYLSNADEINMAALKGYHRELLNALSDERLRGGIIAGLYAPKDDHAIRPGERVFYTPRNAMYIDTARTLIEGIPGEYQRFFLAPLLSEASIHANTSGVFKGFYKDPQTGVGQFGGQKRDALHRIEGNIELPFPVFSNFSSALMVHNGDANKIIREIPEVDVAYLDPPYNQHPYGSNYFMLNLILDYTYPENPSRVSGIPGGWKRSDYNKGNRAFAALRDLVADIQAKFVLISFNSEGFIGIGEMMDMLKKNGKPEVLETKYNTFRGGRNLRGRDIHVTEYLYLLEK